jgi:cytochrome c oxidase cbb3-type subunit IV
MLIYLNAAIEIGQTANGRFPDTDSLGFDNVPLLTAVWRAHSRTTARRVIVAMTIYLLILVAAFIGIVIWVFSRKRKARFEANARIPLDDNKGNQS